MGTRAEKTASSSGCLPERKAQGKPARASAVQKIAADKTAHRTASRRTRWPGERTADSRSRTPRRASRARTRLSSTSPAVAATAPTAPAASRPLARTGPAFAVLSATSASRYPATEVSRRSAGEARAPHNPGAPKRVGEPSSRGSNTAGARQARRIARPQRIAAEAAARPAGFSTTEAQGTEPASRSKKKTAARARA